MATEMENLTKKFRKGDKVIVIAGRDKGKKGEILKMDPSNSRAIVSNVNVVKRHQRQTQTQSGGIIEKELPIHLSNLAVVDPKTGEATRVGMKKLENGRYVRFAKSSGEVLDA